MDNKYDVLDWQSFSEKKDIEEIVKNTKDKNDIQLTAVVEIAMTVSSIVAENLFKENIPPFIWVIIFLISIIPIIWLLYKYLKRFIDKSKPGGDIPDLKSMVDLFDNDICYYVLMAESYSDKIDGVDISSPSDIEQFYFMETCFYINKAIYNLSLTSNCVDKLYSINSKDLYCSRKISYTRLKNIFNILDTCIKKIDSFYSIISNIDINNNYVKLCSEYKNEYKRFKKLFSDIDSSILEQ